MSDELHATCLRATGLLELGLPEEALEELNELTAEHRESSIAIHLRVDALFRLKKWAEAAALCVPKLEAEPGDPGWWIQAAFATRRAECVERAEPILRRALEHHPRHGLILYNLACYACVQDRTEEARQLLEAAAGEDTDLYLKMAEADPDLAAVRSWVIAWQARRREKLAQS